MLPVSMKCHQNKILHSGCCFKTTEAIDPPSPHPPSNLRQTHLSMAAKSQHCFMPLILIENVIEVHLHLEAFFFFYKLYYKAHAGTERGNCPLTYKVQALVHLIDNL